MSTSPLPNDFASRADLDKVDQMLAALPSDHLPNVFLVGTMKSGSSWLAKQLERHPGIFVPGVKEPNFLISPEGAGFPLKGPLPQDQLFARMHKYSAASAADYAALYREATAFPIRVDASIRYLVSDLAADRLTRFHAERGLTPRLLVILRDPVERCWSHWQMHRTMGIEPLSFREALDAEEARLAEGWSNDWGYQLYSRYDRHLARYIDRFGRDALHVEIQEEAVADPAASMTRVLGFLGLNPAEAEAGDPQRAVRVKKPTGSSMIEQVSQYYRPGWRKAMPKPLRQAGWRLLEGLNARLAPRDIPADRRTILRDSLAPSICAIEALLDRSLPWPGGTG